MKVINLFFSKSGLPFRPIRCNDFHGVSCTSWLLLTFLPWSCSRAWMAASAYQAGGTAVEWFEVSSSAFKRRHGRPPECRKKKSKYNQRIIQKVNLCVRETLSIMAQMDVKAHFLSGVCFYSEPVCQRLRSRFQIIPEKSPYGRNMSAIRATTARRSRKSAKVWEKAEVSLVCEVWPAFNKCCYYYPPLDLALLQTCGLMLHNPCMPLFKALSVSPNYSWKKKLIFGAVSLAQIMCVFKPTGHQFNPIT